MMGERSLESYAEDLRGQLGDSRLNCQRLDTSLASFTGHLSTLEVALLPVKVSAPALGVGTVAVALHKKPIFIQLLTDFHVHWQCCS